MRCRVATMIGCWLSATRSTANAQPRCSIYKLPAANAMAANPTANSANTARSSHTKYVCSETSTARNIHIHFRLLSLVFIFFLYPPGHYPIELRLLVYFPHPQLLYHLLGCTNSPEGSNPTVCTCPI